MTSNVNPEPEVSSDSGTTDNVNKSELFNKKLELIDKYMDLATNPKRHSYLLAEPTISAFLVLCLGDEDPRVVERSMEVFKTFGKHSDNIPALQELNFLMEALGCVVRYCLCEKEPWFVDMYLVQIEGSYNSRYSYLRLSQWNSEIQTDLKTEARKLAKKLQANPRAPKPLGELSDSARNIEAGTSNNIPGSSAGKDTKQSLEKPVDLNTTMSTMKRKNKGRETVLLVGNDVLQQKPERMKITQVLINVPGIISVTYDLKNNHCIIRGKRNVPSENFGRAVALLRIADVFIIRKNESGGVIQVPVPGDDQENTMQYPPYPEEVENDCMDESRSVARKDQQETDDSSFLKSAKDFLKRSFYW